MGCLILFAYDVKCNWRSLGDKREWNDRSPVVMVVDLKEEGVCPFVVHFMQIIITAAVSLV